MSIEEDQISSYDFDDAIKDFNFIIEGNEPEGWEKFVNTTNSNGDSTIIWRKADKDSGIYKYKIYGKLKGIDFNNFLEFYKDYEYRTKWDPYSTELEMIEEGDDYIILRWRTHVSFPFINDREFCFKRREKTIDGTWIVIDQNIYHEKAPIKKNPVRLDTYNNVICLKQEDDYVIMFQNYLTPLDFKMSLPSWLLNWASSYGVKNLLSLYREHSTKYPKYLESKKKKEKK